MEWEPEIARLRVSRVVTVIDAGRIINPKAAANQVAGAVVMGVGMGLLEETVYDQRTGQHREREHDHERREPQVPRQDRHAEQGRPLAGKAG